MIEKSPVNFLNIFGSDYVVIDVLEHITMADSFVLRNKIGKGHGEAKLYIGSRQKMNYFLSFFDDFKNITGFFLKTDLEAYLEDAKFEYEEQEQGYSVDISPFWAENKEDLKNLNPIEYFEIKESSAGGEDRFYIQAPVEKSFKIFRRIVLPTITYIVILKLKKIDNGKIFYYFRPFLDYFYDKRSYVERIQKAQLEKDVGMEKENNVNLKNARIGQGLYRARILEEFPAGCLITQINDERLLIASHIKPWADSNEQEKINRYNGLLLSPTYDKLFDQGFITFLDDGTVKTSPYISPLNWKKLNLKNGQHFDLKYNEERSLFLDYHRKNIFKG